MSAVVLAVLGTAFAAAFVWFLAANSTKPERDVRHRPERLYGSETPDFRRALGALLGPPVVGGNRVRTLVNGDRIFGAMLEAIGRAERSVTFEQFIFRDEIAQRFCRAFEAAAARGVHVHVLLDWVGARDADEAALHAAGRRPYRGRPRCRSLCVTGSGRTGSSSRASPRTTGE